MMHKYFKMRANGTRTNESGFTLVEIVAVVVIIGFGLAFLIPNLSNVGSNSKINLAHQEIVGLMSATGQYRQNNNGYVGITTDVLVDNGYYIEKKNVYGIDVTIVISGNNAKITYTLPTAKDCLQLKARLGTLAPITGTPACAVGVLSFDIQ